MDETLAMDDQGLDLKAEQNQGTVKLLCKMFALCLLLLSVRRVMFSQLKLTVLKVDLFVSSLQVFL